MKKEEEKRKHHVNIGTIGHVDRGRSLLMEAILQNSNTENGKNQNIDLGEEESVRGCKRGIEIKSHSIFDEEPPEMQS